MKGTGVQARARLVAVALAGLLTFSACGAIPTRSPGIATIVPFPTSPTAECIPEEILPQIMQVRPLEITPGSEVTLTGTGGYFKDSCGGYNESARTYKVFLDDKPVGELSCYVHHCEGKFRLAQDIATGSHCLGIQAGTCQAELVVKEN